MNTYREGVGWDALGDRTRRAIVMTLAERPQAVGELAASLPVSRPAVSQHLKVLRDSGFAQSRADRSQRIYRIQSERFEEIDDWLDRFRRFWSQGLDRLAGEVEKEG